MRRFAASHHAGMNMYYCRAHIGPFHCVRLVRFRAGSVRLCMASLFSKPFRALAQAPRRTTAAAASTLIVVESPAKARKIEGFLGDSYVVAPSYGHVRQLPPQPGAVDPQRNFEMDWQVPPKKQIVLDGLYSSAQSSDRVLLASDPDREGEAIAWHLAQLFKDKLPSHVTVQRISFSEITKPAVEQAIAAPRAVNQSLVEAYIARISADYLLGFSVSPMLWRKLPGARSAGRVQSVALRLVCDREAERDMHSSIKFYTAAAHLNGTPHCDQVAAMVLVDGQAKFDENPAVGKDSILSKLQAAEHAVVESVSTGSRSQKPPRPYTTARLQQDASRFLGFTAKQTMALAQSLFEDGLITYHRTDGEAIGSERQAAIRSVVQDSFPDALPSSAITYKTKAKNAQEAHDAITVTDPALLAERLDEPGKRKWLYELIWRCTIACQMKNSLFSTVQVKLQAGDVHMRASSRSLTSAGYLSVWNAASSIRSTGDQQAGEDPIDPNEDAAEDDVIVLKTALEDEEKEFKALRSWAVGDKVSIVEANSREHETEPPRQYSEASLVKKMEQLGIGRPSTYARTIDVLEDRGYIIKEKRALVPTSKGRMLAAFLQKFFSKWVDFQFTSGMEERLDDISAGKGELHAFLSTFWRELDQSLQDVDDVTVQQVFEELGNMLEYKLFPPREDGSDPRVCPACGTGRLFLLGTAQGGFVACSNYSEQRDGHRCTFKRTFTGEEGVEDSKALGLHPEHGEMIFLRNGKYGKYVQVSVDGKNVNCALPKNTIPEQLTLEQAVELLKGPEVLGQHPETGMDVLLRSGRFGPYYQHGWLQVSAGKLQGEEPTLQDALLKLELKAKRYGMTQAEAAAQEPKNRAKKSAPAGAMAHHAWVRQWRERTGGTLMEGRQAWKALDTKAKWQFKIDYVENATKTGASDSNGPVDGSKSTSTSVGTKQAHANKAAPKSASPKAASKRLAKAGKVAQRDDEATSQNGTKTLQRKRRAVLSSKSAGKAKPKSLKRM